MPREDEERYEWMRGKKMPLEAFARVREQRDKALRERDKARAQAKALAEAMETAQRGLTPPSPSLDNALRAYRSSQESPDAS